MFEESRFREKKVEPMVCLMTGEPYQPVRLYYRIEKKNALLGRLKRLKCIGNEVGSKRWLWLYEAEAKGIKFTESYREIPKENRPIVLGYLIVKSERELWVDVRSCQRAIEAILFFDQKINRRLARVEKMRIVNRLFGEEEVREGIGEHHRQFFEERKVVSGKEKRAEIEKIIEENKEEEKEERVEALLSVMEKQMGEKLPLVEEIETYYYEEGIARLKFLLGMRELEAKENWIGNEKFSQLDIIQEMMSGVDEEE